MSELYKSPIYNRVDSPPSLSEIEDLLCFIKSNPSTLCKPVGNDKNTDMRNDNLNNIKQQCSIFVCNISFAVTESDIRALFENVTRVLKFNLVDKKDDTGRLIKRFAFVTVESKETMKMVIQSLNGFILNGRNLVLRENEKYKKDL